MGFFLEADKQHGEAEDAYEDGALLFRNEMDTVLDDGDHDGNDHQEDFDRQALKADWRQQICYPITCAGDGQAENQKGRQEYAQEVYERMKAANIPEEQARAIAFG